MREALHQPILKIAIHCRFTRCQVWLQQRPKPTSSTKKRLAVIPKLVDRLPNIIEREVLRRLLQPGENIRRPATREFLQRADVEIPVVEELLQRRHLASEKAAILADAVPAHGRSTRFGVFPQKLERHSLGISGAELAEPNTIRQARLTVRPAVPLVHAGEHRLRLVDGDDRSFGDHVQIGIGDDRRDLDDVVEVRTEPRHFEVDPDKVVRRGRHEKGPK